MYRNKKKKRADMFGTLGLGDKGEGSENQAGGAQAAV